MEATTLIVPPTCFELWGFWTFRVQSITEVAGDAEPVSDVGDAGFVLWPAEKVQTELAGIGTGDASPMLAVSTIRTNARGTEEASKPRLAWNKFMECPFTS
jgi:hypothetical protein